MNDKQTQQHIFKTIIFDFDGTLADTFPVIVEINNRLYKKLHTDPIDHKEALKLKEVPVMQWMSIFELPFWKFPFFLRTIINELHKEMPNVKPFPHIHAMLESIKRDHIKIGLLTTDTTDNVKKFLKLHDLSNYFSFVEHADFYAGKSFALARIMLKRKIKPTDTLYVGDTTRDIKDAHRVKMKVAAVTWGYNTKALLQKYNPDFVVDSADDLRVLVDL